MQGHSPGKSVGCSSDPESGFGNVPLFYFHYLFNALNITNRNVPKEETLDNLRMISSLKVNLLVLKPEIYGRCSSIW